MLCFFHSCQWGGARRALPRTHVCIHAGMISYVHTFMNDFKQFNVLRYFKSSDTVRAVGEMRPQSTPLASTAKGAFFMP